MFRIQLDGVEAISAKLEGMIEKIRELKTQEMADGFADWQRDDLGREHAAVQKARGGWRTTIRPHSRYETQASRGYQRRQLRRVSTGTVRAAKAYMVWQAKHSTRPILRPELYDELRARMLELVQDKLRW